MAIYPHFLKWLTNFDHVKKVGNCYLAFYNPYCRFSCLEIAFALTFTTMWWSFFVTNRFPVSHDLQTMWTLSKNIESKEKDFTKYKLQKTNPIHSNICRMANLSFAILALYLLTDTMYFSIINLSETTQLIDYNYIPDFKLP